MSVESEYFSDFELQNIVMKEILGQESAEKNDKRLAYYICSRFCDANQYSWREKIDYLKDVRRKLNGS